MEVNIFCAIIISHNQEFVKLWIRNGLFGRMRGVLYPISWMGSGLRSVLFAVESGTFRYGLIGRYGTGMYVPCAKGG